MRDLRTKLLSCLLLLAALGAVWLAGPRAHTLLATTLQVSAGVVLLALPLGSLLAVLIVKTDLPGRAFAATLLLAMLFVPLHLHASAWRAMVGGMGWFTQLTAGDGPIDPLLRGAPGVVWVHAMAAVPWVALIVGAALRSIDRRLEENALLNSSAPRVLLTVSLRYAAPAILAAAGWLVVIVASEMTVTDLFQVRTFAEEVYTQHALGLFDPFQSPDDSRQMQKLQLASGLAAIGLTAIAVLWHVSGWIGKARTSQDQSPWRWRPARRWLGGGVLATLLLLLAGVPIGSLVYKAGMDAVRDGDQWRREWSPGKAVQLVASAPVERRREFWQSTKLGAVVATGAVFLGAAIAWRLARGGERLAWLAALAVCLTTPGPMIAIAAIRVFNQPSDSTFSFLTWLYDHTLTVPAIVQLIRATPIVALLLWPVWQAVPSRLMDAVRLDGAQTWAVAARMRLPALAAAWLAALAVSFGELSSTLLVMPPGDQTVTIQLFVLLHSGVDDQVAAISLVMAAVFAALAWLVQKSWARKT